MDDQYIADYLSHLKNPEVIKTLLLEMYIDRTESVMFQLIYNEEYDLVCSENCIADGKTFEIGYNFVLKEKVTHTLLLIGKTEEANHMAVIKEMKLMEAKS